MKAMIVGKERKKGVSKSTGNVYDNVLVHVTHKAMGVEGLAAETLFVKAADIKANFSAAVHICRQFFLGNVSPPNVEALIRRYVSPIRPGRFRPRNVTAKRAVSFMYRVA